MLYDVDIEASACVLSSRYAMLICQTIELCSFLAVKAHILRCTIEMATQ